MMDHPVLLLASNSPRRRQLLAMAGWDFSPFPVDIDESPLPGEDPRQYVLRLAESKAREAEERQAGAQVILAADTTVADEHGLLGKPSSPDQAVEMLHGLRGRPHLVHTGVAIYHPGSTLLVDACTTTVFMREYSEEEIITYIASGDPMDKAGAYAIQHAGFHPVERIDGCYSNVMGLPLCLMQAMLVRSGYPPRADLPSCPINYHHCAFCTTLAGDNYAE
jgi:septum formation protein